MCGVHSHHVDLSAALYPTSPYAITSVIAKWVKYGYRSYILFVSNWVGGISHGTEEQSRRLTLTRSDEPTLDIRDGK